jgi:SAM-dependent methyltransferase
VAVFGAVPPPSRSVALIACSITTPLAPFTAVVALITPWNLPLYLLSWKVAPALATGNAVICKPSELTPLTASLLAGVVHALGLHWADDPVGQLVQCRRALSPDGMLMALLFGGQTLHELRSALAQAETEVTGGLSPRVAPMAEIRDLGGLLQRAGFAFPVADSFVRRVLYRDLFHLMHDLRAMGEGNALAARLRHPTRRAVFARAAAIYAEAFGRDGKIPATFEIITLTGWDPHESQQKPLRPGSAQALLAEALTTARDAADS